jgi:hypothetical protein
VQGCQFNSDFKVLPLLYFDIILGYDWLEQHNPMRIHWLDKWMSIPYNNSTVMVQAILSQLTSGAVVQVCHITEEDLQLDSEDAKVK